MREIVEGGGGVKVILEAFGGKLKSAPMDWPERFLPRIKMMLDMPKYEFDGEYGVLNPTMPRHKIGQFEASGKFEVLPDGRTAEIYVLVEVVG